MKIFNSIKWRLQIWYGFFLALVLMGFIGVSSQLEYDRQFHNIDVILSDHTRTIMDFIGRPPRPDESERREISAPTGPRGGFHLPPHDIVNALFDKTGTNGFYFVIWSQDGEELMRSINAPTDLTMPTDQIWTRMRGIYREQFVPFPGRQPVCIILVGHSVATELKEFHKSIIKLIAWGFGMLSVGLFVGWLISSRMIKPIENISTTAAKISAGDLSQRINVAETESELGKLAAVLNSTFARLESAFAQQKQFASDAAHELRTPVSVILTQTQTTLTREREAKDYKETVEACQRAAQRMKRLISALLELTRLDAGQQHIKRKRFDFKETVHESVELIRPIAEEHGLKLISELAPIEITGDSNRLAQVVTNLLTNAIQYNKPHGEIRVKLESQNGLAVLTVADTGQGISHLDLPHVFKRFYRGDKSRTGASNAGLGLAICKAIVEAHSGIIEVESQEEVGTTFTIRLPV